MELLQWTPFRAIGLIRIYLNTPPDLDPYATRQPYDYICAIVYRPRHRTGEIKGLSTHTGGWTKAVHLAFLDWLHDHLGLTEIAYERASGKAPRLRYRGPGRWRSTQPRRPRRPQQHHPLDINVISG